MNLSLLLPIRGRHSQVNSVLPRLCEKMSAWNRRCEIIVVESAVRPEHQEVCATLAGVRYRFDAASGPFHKSRLLNVALAMARGKIVAPYDIDLLPFRETAARHLEMAAANPNLLVVGYRLMCDCETPASSDDDMREQARVAPENSPTAIRKWLVDGERFGIVPHFSRDRIERLGGWDETYVGWGAEDQDIIERYVHSGPSLVASPDLLYLHLAHPPESSWREPELIEANRARFYALRPKRGRSEP